MDNTSDWNPRYVAYAKAHGRGPQDMLAYDTEKWPGGCMTGFILWMAKRKTEFFKKHPEFCIGPHIGNQEAWTRFLQNAEVSHGDGSATPPHAKP